MMTDGEKMIWAAAIIRSGANGGVEVTSEWWAKLRELVGAKP